MERKQYWNQDKVENTAEIELRSRLTWQLVHHFGSVAADSKDEDSAGRARLVLQTPQELVNRCYEIADIFVTTAEGRSELKEVEPFEVRHNHIGKGRRIQMEAEFNRDKVEK